MAEIDNKIAELLMLMKSQGVKISFISKQTGVSRQRIYKYLKKHNGKA